MPWRLSAFALAVLAFVLLLLGRGLLIGRDGSMDIFVFGLGSAICAWNGWIRYSLAHGVLQAGTVEEVTGPATVAGSGLRRIVEVGEARLTATPWATRLFAERRQARISFVACDGPVGRGFAYIVAIDGFALAHPVLVGVPKPRPFLTEGP